MPANMNSSPRVFLYEGKNLFEIELYNSIKYVTSKVSANRIDCLENPWQPSDPKQFYHKTFMRAYLLALLIKFDWLPQSHSDDSPC